MAEFNLAALLANAAQTNADFDFGKLNKSYYQGLDEAYKKRTRDAFMGPDVLTNGRIDPDKLLQKATQVGGLPAAEQLQSLFNTGQLQQRFEAGKETYRDRFGGSPSGPQSPSQQSSLSPSSPSTFPPSPSRDPAIVTEPKAPRTAPARPQQAVTPFTQFLTAQGIPPDQQTEEALKLQQGFMQLTGRPFDTSKQLNLADNDTRQVLGKYVLARAAQGQQPQALQATQVGPAGPVAAPGPANAMAQQSPFVPQQAAPPPVAQPVPQQTAPSASPQQPVVPRPVQTVPIQNPAANPTANDPSLGGIITPAEIQRFGTWQRALEVYEKALSRPEGLPAAMQADLEKKVAAIREQLKLTEGQKEYEYQRARNPAIAPYQQWQDEQKSREGRVKADTAVAEELNKNAAQIRTTLPILEQVARLAQSAPGGQAGVLAAKLAPIMSGLGMKVPENISDAEALNAVVFRLLPLVRQPGSVLNYEQQSYLSALPGLASSKEGRAKALDIMLKLANRGIAVSDVYRDNIGAADLNKKLAALDTPIFTKDEKAELEALAGAARGDNIGWSEVRPGVKMRTRDKGQ